MTKKLKQTISFEEIVKILEEEAAIIREEEAYYERGNDYKELDFSDTYN